MFKYRQGSAGREPASRAESGAKAGIRCESPGQPVEMSGKLASVSASRPRGMTWEDWKSCKKLPKDEHLRGVIIGLGGKSLETLGQLVGTHTLWTPLRLSSDPVFLLLA
ncbi:uncharacterized protein LOC141560526 isoform X3 [Sminthopsis crassicaudata]|uniref:uncharacterized protein LOC141560526 isoform X3 n=1 Tax=Sminthopsis crassicaudata TaxID=9301 RepID=UPI003D69517B